MLVNMLTIKIFDLICVNEITDSYHILKVLDLNERKFRYELDILSMTLNNHNWGEIYLKNKKIYFKLNDTPNNILSYLNKCLKLSSIERINYIFLCLISENFISLSKIANDLFVTKATIKKDLIKLKDTLYNISIKFDGHYFLDGNEIDVRKKAFETLSTVVFENKNNKMPDLIMKSYNLALDIYNKLNINYMINNNLVFTYILVLIIRIKNGKTLKKDIDNEISNIKLYNAIILAFSELNVNKYEINAFYRFIINTISNYDNIITDKWIEFRIITRNFIDNMSIATNIPFIQDKFLLKGLENHIPQSIYRCKKNIKLGDLNYLFDEFMTNKLIEVVKKEIEYIENIFQIKFSIEEILLYAVHFEASIERNNNNCKNYKKVLLLCVGGYGTTKILINKLTNRYNFNKIDIISLMQLKQIDINEYDILISTIDVDNIDFGNKIKISPFLTNKELKKLDSLFEIKNNSLNYENLLLNLKENHDIDVIQRQTLINEFNTLKYETISMKYFNNIEFCKIKFNTWEDTIRYGVSKMVELGIVNDDYANKIIDIINEYGSYMIITKNIALPHAKVENENYKTGVYIIYLKYPIIFPGRKRVKLLFFVHINCDDSRELIDNILQIIDNGQDLNKIQNVEDLKSYLSYK